MPEPEEQSPKEARSSKVDFEEKQSDRVPLTRLPPRTGPDVDKSTAPPAKPISGKGSAAAPEAAPVVVEEESLSANPETVDNETEKPPKPNRSAGFPGGLVALVVAALVFAGFILTPVDKSAPQKSVAQTSDPRASTNFSIQENRSESRIESQITPPSNLRSTPKEIPRAEPINPKVLLAYKMLQARSEYDSALEKPEQAKRDSSREALNVVNYQYIYSLESAQRSIRPSTSLYQAFSNEIALSRQYASRPPHIIDIEAIARANPASRLSPYRKTYSTKIRALLPSHSKASGKEEEAAVELILEAREVIAEIREYYAGRDGDQRSLREEFRLLKRSIPEKSANFKTLRSTIGSLENELLKTQISPATEPLQSSGFATP